MGIDERYIPKFLDNVNINILDSKSGTAGSPTSHSPGFSLRSINLRCNDSGSVSSHYPIESKKSKSQNETC